MTPDEHADQARRLLGRYSPSSWNRYDDVVVALQALTHAVLSLRTERPPRDETW